MLLCIYLIPFGGIKEKGSLTGFEFPIYNKFKYYKHQKDNNDSNYGIEVASE